MRESEWSKAVRKAMIDKGISNVDLANWLGVKPQFTSNVICGSTYSEKRAKQISEILEVSEPYTF